MTSALQLKLLMLGILAYVSYFHVKSILLGRKSRDWRRVKAEITASGIDRESGTYYPKIIYRYAINGREYINDTYTFIGTGEMLKRNVISVALQNPVGKQIDVFVDPNDPSRSVIVPGAHISSYLNIVLFVLMLGGIAFLPELLTFFWPGCQPNCT